MSNLAEMLAKARRAVLRRVAAEDADELAHDAFIKVEHYERARAAQSRETLLVKAAADRSIDRARLAEIKLSAAALRSPDRLARPRHPRRCPAAAR